MKVTNDLINELAKKTFFIEVEKRFKTLQKGGNLEEIPPPKLIKI